MQVVLERTTSPGVYAFLDRFRVIKIDPGANKSKWRVEDLHTGQKHPISRMRDGVGLIEKLLGGLTPAPVEEKKPRTIKEKKPKTKKSSITDGTSFVDRISQKFGTQVEIVAWKPEQAVERLEKRYPDTIVLGVTAVSGDNGISGYRMRATIVPIREVWASIPRLFPG